MKLTKTDEYKSHGKTFGWGSSPHADWRVMFSLFLFMMFLVVVYAGLSFYQIWQGNFATELTDSSDSPINKNLLKRNTEFYKNREASFESIKSAPETTPDPSR